MTNYPKHKVIRTSTIPMSLSKLLKGQLKFLNQHFDVVGASSEGDFIYDVIKDENIRVEVINMERQISLRKDIQSLWNMYHFLKKEKPLIVHSITPKAGLLSMLAGKLAGVPIRIHTFTGLIFPEKKGFLQQILIYMDRLLCFCATNIYPEGRGVMNDLIRYNITKKPLKVLANGNVNGIDTDYFDSSLFSQEQKDKLRVDLQIEESDFVFLFIGRLVGDKGINELIGAFNELSESYQNIKLLLVGPEEKDLDPLHSTTIKILEENNNIISVGYQADVRSFFAIADALVFPSYREGFPNVVMQAGAMGLPSIVTDINGCNEIIIEGQNGTIIPSKDASVLNEKMELFIKDEFYLKRLKDNAREMIVSRYQQNVVWEAILHEYKTLEEQYVSKLS